MSAESKGPVTIGVFALSQDRLDQMQGLHSGTAQLNRFRGLCFRPDYSEGGGPDPRLRGLASSAVTGVIAVLPATLQAKPMNFSDNGITRYRAEICRYNRSGRLC
jgi:hypothetical protein